MPRGEKKKRGSGKSHIKKVGGRAYRYEMSSISVKGSKFLKAKEIYVEPVDRVKPTIMERLTRADEKKIKSAWVKGISVERIAGYVEAATGQKPAAQTIYSYFSRKGIKRGKLKTSAGSRRKIDLTEFQTRMLDSSWEIGQEWQEVRDEMQRYTGKRLSKASVYAFFRERGIKRRR